MADLSLPCLPSPPPPLPPDPVFTFRPHSGTVQTLQYVNYDGMDSVLTGMSSGFLSLWDLRIKRQYWIQELDGNVISCKFVHCKGVNCIISSVKEGKLTQWNVETSSIMSEISTNGLGFCGVGVVESDVPRIVMADNEFGKINVFNLTTQSIDTMITATEPQCRVFEKSGVKHIVGGFEDGKVICWDIRNPGRELSYTEMFSEPVMCLDYNADTSHGVCGSPSNSLETFTFTENGLCQKYTVAVKNSGISSVKVRLDGRIMASGGWDGRVRVFGCKKGKPLAILDFHTDSVQTLDFAPSGRGDYSNLLICGSKDERISLWKLY